MIIVRPAVPADVPGMSRVLIASITELCSLDHHDDPAAIAAWTANKTVDGVAAMLHEAQNQLLVAQLGGEIAAVGQLAVRQAIEHGAGIGVEAARGLADGFGQPLQFQVVRGCAHARHYTPRRSLPAAPGTTTACRFRQAS